jgi:hypothetical protein
LARLNFWMLEGLKTKDFEIRRCSSLSTDDKIATVIEVIATSLTTQPFTIGFLPQGSLWVKKEG